MKSPRKPDTPLPECLAGSLLLAQPGMPDPNFRRTVILLSNHGKDGALGVIVNRPAGITIGSLQSDLVGGSFGDLPVYEGGPVQRDRLILAAWRCSPGSEVFKLYFGLDPERLERLREEDPELTVRAFRGYSGWSAGQLEAELARKDWIVCPVDPIGLSATDGLDLWRNLVSAISPALRLRADLPDDPSLN